MKIRCTRQNSAVSEVLGTILLLVISVSLFSVVYASFAFVQVTPDAPFVNIIGTIEDNKLILEHRGGERLDLTTEIILDYKNGTRDKISIEDYLSQQYKDDGKWNIGERFIYPLINSTNFNRFDPLDLMIIHKNSNSIIMSGTVKEAKVADIKIEMTVSEDEPNINDPVTFTITVTNNNGPANAENIKIKNDLPGSLQYVSNDSSQGTYNPNSGIWKVGDLDVNKFATLNITANVISQGSTTQYTQLAFVLDGSGSITSLGWGIIKDGIESAILDSNIFPHDGSVELTIIQFGVGSGGYCARLEVGPVVINNNNYQNVAGEVSNMTFGSGYTPMASGIYLVADALASSNNFGGFKPDNRQIINLVTDGNPNIATEQGELCGDGYDGYPQGKAAAENARYYLLNALSMTSDQDEFDVVAINGNQGVDVDWLKTEIAWPQPGNVSWPPMSPGWVHEVIDPQEFADTVDEQFDILFKRIDSCAELHSTKYMDPYQKNNQATISIYPITQ